jgi:formylglycine-generating enzyme required for sulfatase activity
VTSRYFGESVEMLPRYAWCQANSPRRIWPVGQKKPNDFGLFDMLGNAWEWCHVWQHYPGNGALVDNDTEAQGAVERGQARVFRGGAFFGTPDDLRCAARNWNYPHGHFHGSIGFRVARTVR